MTARCKNKANVHGLRVSDLELLRMEVHRDPLLHYRPTKPHLRMLSDTSPIAQMRGPNQVGKTTCLAADLLDLMLGRGRWDVTRPVRHTPPVRVWVVCASWDDVVTVSGKIYELLPKSELAEGCVWSPRTGFGSKTLVTRNGSIAIFKTSGQDPTSLESDTLDAIYVNELTEESVWGAFVARVNQRRGFIRLYYCPIGRPVHWIKTKVESGEIVDHHFDLSLKNCWPIGAMSPFKTQRQIDDFSKAVRAAERAQRVGGDWYGPPLDPSFRDFNPADHIRAERPAGPHWLVAVGIDHATQQGKQAACLVAVQGGNTISPRIVFLDERVAPRGVAWTMEDLADQIFDMIGKNHLRYEDVDKWAGDRPATSRRGVVASNVVLRGHLALRFKTSDPKPISVPHKGPGSVNYVCGMINDRFASKAALVSPKCARLIEFFQQFDGDEHHPTKDVGDAARYAVMALVSPKWYNTDHKEKIT